MESEPTDRRRSEWPSMRDEGVRLLRVLLVIGFFYMCRKLLVPTVLGAIFAVVCEPLRLRLSARLGRASGLAPALVTLIVTLVFLLPTTFVVWKAVAAANTLLGPGLGGTLEHAEDAIVSRIGPLVSGPEFDESAVRANLHAATGRLVGAIGSTFGAAARAFPEYLTDAFLFVLSLYYFARDGAGLVDWLRTKSPVGSARTASLFESVRVTVNGTVLGTVVVAIVQGTLALVALLAFGVPGAFLWGLVATICSVLPVIGTTPVTGGAAIWLFLAGRPGAALGMLVAAVFIGTIDNVIRPMVVSSHDDMHPLVALLAIFGGLSSLGPSGVFLGPVFAAIALWATQVDRAPHGATLPPSEDGTSRDA